MSRFNAALALDHISEHGGRYASGGRIVPVGTAIIAVLAALATLFANHSSVRSLAYKNEALLYQSQATDRYNFYESKLVRAQVDQSFLDSGTVAAKAETSLRGRVERENTQARPVLETAQSLEEQAERRFADSERVMASYESFEIAAVVLEIAVVLASITAMTRGPVMFLVSSFTALAGFGFLLAGFAH